MITNSKPDWNREKGNDETRSPHKKSKFKMKIAKCKVQNEERRNGRNGTAEPQRTQRLKAVSSCWFLAARKKE